ncbi:MAG: hypothetical protein ABW042_04995, partial [Phenylobacterium sp.]
LPAGAAVPDVVVVAAHGAPRPVQRAPRAEPAGAAPEDFAPEPTMTPVRAEEPALIAEPAAGDLDIPPPTGALDE